MFYSNDPFGFGSSSFPRSPFSSYQQSYSPYEQRRRQELARRKRMMDVERERRQRAEIERRKRMELQRREQIMKMQQQREDEEMTRRRNRVGEYAPGTIVRGPDGNLYRIVAPPDYESNDKMRRSSNSDASSVSSNSEASKSVSASEVEKGEHRNDDEMIKDECFDEDDIGSMKENCEIPIQTVDPNSKRSSPAIVSQLSDLTDKSPPLNMVSVEDVSDDEDEELRELHSYWRNRLPSPGQWMEPIELRGQ